MERVRQQRLLDSMAAWAGTEAAPWAARLVDVVSHHPLSIDTDWSLLLCPVIAGMEKP